MANAQISDFQLDPSSTEPVYKQIMAQVRRLVAAGQLRAGDELPSVREMASAFAINPMTVSKAYGYLEAEKTLERPRGQRMVIAQGFDRAKTLHDRLALLRPRLQAAARESRELGLSSEQALKLFTTILKDEAP
jgi:GntR family transcriptional regulator